MIIWRGKGLMVLLVSIPCFSVVPIINLIMDYSTRDSHLWPYGVAAILAGIPCWFLGQHLREKSIEKYKHYPIEEDFDTGNLDSFYYIPVRWWGPVYGVIGIGLIISEFIK